MRPHELTFDLLYEHGVDGRPSLTVLVDAPGVGAASMVTHVDLAEVSDQFVTSIEGNRESNHDSDGYEVARLLLSDPDVAWVFDTAMAGGATLLRFRLKSTNDVLHRIPWELLRREASIEDSRLEFSPALEGLVVVRSLPVVDRIVIRRQQDVSSMDWRRDPTDEGGEGVPERILLVEALEAPERDRLDSQLDLIKRSAGSSFEVKTLHVATKEAIRETGRQTRPTIVHVNGHGLTDASGICLADGTVSNKELAEMLSSMPSIRLVVLSCCYSNLAALALAEQGIDSVVGVQYETGEGRADRFVRAFYTALRDASPLEAVSRGRTGVGLGDGLEWALPVLYSRLRVPHQQESQAEAVVIGSTPQGQRDYTGPWAAAVDAAGEVQILDAQTSPIGGEPDRRLLDALSDATGVVLTADGAYAVVTSAQNAKLIPLMNRIGREPVRVFQLPSEEHAVLVSAHVTRSFAKTFMRTDQGMIDVEYSLNRDRKRATHGGVTVRANAPRGIAVFESEWIEVGAAGDLTMSDGASEIGHTLPAGGWEQIDAACGPTATLVAGLRRSELGLPAVILGRRDDAGVREPRFIPLSADTNVDEVRVVRSASPDAVVVRVGDELRWWTWDQAQGGPA